MITLLESFIIPFVVNIGSTITYDKIKKHFTDEASPKTQTYKALCASISQFCDEYGLVYKESITMVVFMNELKACDDIKWHLRDVLEKTTGCDFSDRQFKRWIELLSTECKKFAFADDYGKTEPFTNRETVRIRLEESLKKIGAASLTVDLEQLQADCKDFGDYGTIFNMIFQRFSLSWKETVISILNQVKYDKSVKKEEIEYIHSEERCDFILSRSRALLDHIDWKKSNVSEEEESLLYSILKEPHFDKVLLVSGTSGSGKSHFIKKTIQDAAVKLTQRDMMFLPCIIKLSSRDLEKDIVSSLTTLFDEKNVKSIYEFIGIASALNIKLCLIIENVNILLDGDRQKATWFIDAIKNFCRYETFRFILTINEYEYYHLACHQEFISRYCVSVQDSIFSGINIGEFNKEQEVVSNILYSCSINPFFDVRLTTPLEAIYYTSCVKDSVAPTPPSTYLEYIQMITAWKDSELSGDGKRNLFDLLQDVTTQKSTTITTQINVKPFIDVQLLSTEQQEQSVFGIKYEEKYHLRIYPYWAAKIFGKEILTNEKIDLLAYPEELKEWLITCYLFYGVEDEENFVYQLKNSGLVDYALFLAHKGTDRLTRILYDYLVSDNLPVRTPRFAFAILHFISKCKLELSEKFELCVLVSHAVCRFNLNDLYKRTLGIILRDVGDTHDLMVDMLILSKIRNSTINYINGYTVCSKIVDLTKSISNIEFNVENIVVFLILRLQEREDLRNLVQKGNNESFLDFFLRACYEYALALEKSDLQVLYYQHKRFFRERKPIGAFIRRNLTCAAGNLFSYKTYKKYQSKYIKLVQKMISKGEKQSAWFMIRNSIENDNKPLHPELYKLLIDLTKDQNLMTIHGREIKKLRARQIKYIK